MEQEYQIDVSMTGVESPLKGTKDVTSIYTISEIEYLQNILEKYLENIPVQNILTTRIVYKYSRMY